MPNMNEFHDEEDCGCVEYNQLSRREFLGTSAATAAAVYFPEWLPKVVLAESHSGSRDVLLSVFLRGGADGLSLCVPFGDPGYYTARSTIAIPHPDSGAPNRTIPLDNFFGFPPAMMGLHDAWLEGNLLIAHAAGQYNTSRSHFDAQRYMEVGKPADPNLVTDWLGRHLASVPPLRTDAPLRALGLSQGLPKTLVGAPKTLPIASPSTFVLGGRSSTQNSRLAFLQGDYALEPEPVLHAAALDATNTIELLRSINFNGYVAANGAVYPNTSFGRALKSVATLIKSDVGIEAAQVDIGGWDTHASQDPLAGSMFNTMVNFSNSLGAFHADVIAMGFGCTVVVISEFGRNVRQNGSAGTDHGRATAAFAMGQNINGGQVLTVSWPGLATAQLESGRDLRVTMDYRHILAEVIENRLGNSNLDFIFPGFTPVNLGVTI
jgi:uncharacterized protein (DUF1501 family)